MKSLSIFAVILLLTACGGTNTEKDDSATVNKNTAPSTKSHKATLSTSAIDIDAAFYNGPIEYTKIDPCPFLTDKTAKGTFKRIFGLDSSSHERISVSNTECTWSYFSVRLPSEKNSAYRLNQIKKYDGEQALKPQTGPGKDAFLYYSKLDNKKKQNRPSGFIFSQNGKTIFIRGTAITEPTGVEKLREVANEIARLLPDAAEIKEQSTKVIHRFNTCKIWDKETLASTLHIDKLNPPMYGPSLGKTCKYQFYEKLPKSGSKASFDLQFNFGPKGKKDVCDALIKKGAKLEKEFTQRVVSRTKKGSDSFSSSSETLTSCLDRGTFSFFISGPDLRYSKQIRLLVKNALERISSKN